MIEDFYQLPKIEDNRVIWQCQADLRDFINNLCNELNLDGELDLAILEAKLILTLFQNLISDSAYPQLLKVWQCWLSKRCVIVAKANKFRNYFSNSTLEDLFQDYYCHSQAGNPVKFFHGFDPTYGETPCFNAWSDNKIRKCLGNQRSNLGLAVYESRRTWLRMAKSRNEKEQFEILHGCVRTFKDSTQVSLDKWQEWEFEEIANLYNQFTENSLHLSGTKVLDILSDLGLRIRYFLCDRPISLDTPIGEEGTTTLKDTVDIKPQSDEHELSFTELRERITTVVSNINHQKKRIVFLIVCLEFSQSEVSQQLGISQATISRCVSKIFQAIVHSFDLDEITPTSEDLKAMKEIISEHFYWQQIEAILVTHLAGSSSIIPDIIEISQLDFYLRAIEFKFQVSLSELPLAIESLIQKIQKRINILSRKTA